MGIQLKQVLKCDLPAGCNFKDLSFPTTSSFLRSVPGLGVEMWLLQSVYTVSSSLCSTAMKPMARRRASHTYGFRSLLIQSYKVYKIKLIKYTTNQLICIHIIEYQACYFTKPLRPMSCSSGSTTPALWTLHYSMTSSLSTSPASQVPEETFSASFSRVHTTRTLSNCGTCER